jgi:hypothetical protein
VVAFAYVIGCIIVAIGFVLVAVNGAAICTFVYREYRARKTVVVLHKAARHPRVKFISRQKKKWLRQKRKWLRRKKKADRRRRETIERRRAQRE